MTSFSPFSYCFDCVTDETTSTFEQTLHDKEWRTDVTSWSDGLGDLDRENEERMDGKFYGQNYGQMQPLL